jgi:hypothetical protein
MAQFDGAVIREQGVTFAAVAVRPTILQNSQQATDAIASFQPAFPGLPIVLMAQDGRGRPTYYGRRDISQFMARVPLGSIPWRRYTIS